MSVLKNKPAASSGGPPVSRLWMGIGVVGVIAVIMLIAPQWNNEGTFPAEVTAGEVRAMREEGAFMLDVREPSEWGDAHLADSTLIPLGQLTTRLGEVPRDKLVVVISRTGDRNQAAREVLLEAGYKDVTSLAGGLTAWIEAGYPTVK